MSAIRYPFWQPEVGASEHRRVGGVLDSAFLNDGGVTAEFEKQLAERLGSRHVIGVTSGTAAIALALRAAGIGPGDEVLVPDVTFIATANAVHLAGATPVLVDVREATLMFDPAAASRRLSSRTRAVVPVHVSGRSADLPAIAAFAAEHELLVIEDAAEAFVSAKGGKCLGTHALAGCFSFSPNKTIMTGQGGAIVTDDDRLAATVRELKDQGRPVRGTGGADEHLTVGFNFKLTNLQAAVGLAQLEVLDERLRRMREMAREYREHLAGVPQVRLFEFDLEGGESPQWIDAIVERRDELDAFLLARGAQCRKFWFPLHTQRPYHHGDDLFPVSSRMVPQAIWFPSAFQLTPADIATVSGWIREFYERD